MCSLINKPFIIVNLNVCVINCSIKLKFVSTYLLCREKINRQEFARGRESDNLNDYRYIVKAKLSFQTGKLLFKILIKFVFLFLSALDYTRIFLFFVFAKYQIYISISLSIPKIYTSSTRSLENRSLIM